MTGGGSDHSCTHHAAQMASGPNRTALEYLEQAQAKGVLPAPEWLSQLRGSSMNLVPGYYAAEAKRSGSLIDPA
jgi:hypothetical protein